MCAIYVFFGGKFLGRHRTSFMYQLMFLCSNFILVVCFHRRHVVIWQEQMRAVADLFFSQQFINSFLDFLFLFLLFNLLIVHIQFWQFGRYRCVWLPPFLWQFINSLINVSIHLIFFKTINRTHLVLAICQEQMCAVASLFVAIYQLYSLINLFTNSFIILFINRIIAHIQFWQFGRNRCVWLPLFLWQFILGEEDQQMLRSLYQFIT